MCRLREKKGWIKDSISINISDKAEVMGWICSLSLKLQKSFASRPRRHKVLLVLLLAKKAYSKLLMVNYLLLADTWYINGKENSAVWSIFKELRRHAFWKTTCKLLFRRIVYVHRGGLGTEDIVSMKSQHLLMISRTGRSKCKLLECCRGRRLLKQ